MDGWQPSQHRARLDIDRLIYKEVCVRGVFAEGSKSYRESITLLERNVDRLAPLHTQDVGFQDREGHPHGCWRRGYLRVDPPLTPDD